MTSSEIQIEEIYQRLSQALEDPRSFGLENGTIPQPLAELLHATHRMLGRLLAEATNEASDNGLEAELSQDADRD
jgi:hypothetical protein